MSELRIKRLCIFCGSSPGKREIYVEQASAMGQELARRKIGLVYGGGGIGLMGAVARAVIDAQGEVIGVIPHSLAGKERALEASFEMKVELRVVKTMHERKALMVKLADGFIALPGGYGTFDELFEALTWGQLGIHQKPIGLLNTAGYFDPFLAMVDRAIEDGFVLPRYRSLLTDSTEIETLLDKMHGYQPLESIVKWVDLDET